MAISTELARMCLDRGEPLDTIRLKSYTDEFAGRFEDQDIFAWMRRMRLTKREDYEAKIPTLADAMEMIEKIARKREWDSGREEREEAARIAHEAYRERWHAERAAEFKAWKDRKAAEQAAPLESPPREPIVRPDGSEYIPVNLNNFRG